ncbi:alpha/beta hydrolase family protein [Paraglaciecola chathamensis]|uniref:hypothetical protein n=1 Tax=Paraglaciecola chathamensis TaxID=368405 RepID=UPI0027071EBB|nr:hypothetical protein [Paraglaciecola chathamensis]MDO6561055.1 hypothetical protein [Paraglaciecola chathamensis]
MRSPAILETLSELDAIIIAEHRAKNTDPFEHAKKLQHQVEHLIEKGVPATNISLVGFSRGGFITAIASSYTLKKARELAADNKANVRNGIDQKLERKQTGKMTVDDVAQEWLKERERNIENPQIPARVYRRDIKAFIGELPVDQVTSIYIT